MAKGNKSTPKNPNPRDRSVTVRDVAREAGVSLATVSYALNGNGSVGEEMRQHVKDVAAKLGYRPNQRAQAMRTGKSNTIGLILPDLRNPFFPELAQAVEHAARERGYATFLIDTHVSTDHEYSGIERLLQQGVDGIIWFPASQKDTASELKAEVPIVVLDRQLKKYDRVIPDHFKGGVMQAAHLADSEHKKFAIVSGPQDVDNMRLRRDGAVAEISKQQGELLWEVETVFGQTLSPDVKTALKDNKATAIIAGNDMIALSVIRELKGLGVKVPEQVSIIGFDNVPWCDLVDPRLSTVSMPLAEIGLQAVRILFEQIDGKSINKQQEFVVDLKVVERESVAAPSPTLQ